MAGLLQDKVAFVTGGASGIGRATALAFAGEGARVAVADLNGAAETVAAIEEAGGEGWSIALDVREEDRVNAVVDEIVERWGQIDCAFNNAGISLETLETPWPSIEAYDDVVAVNQRGVLLCMAAELRHMAPRRSGAIVNTASVAGMAGLSGAGYCGSKHAVVGFTRSAAMHYARDGIRINAVCPGVVVTPMTAEVASSAEGRSFMEQMTPMNRMGEPREVADAVIFLCSDKASFITGHPLAVDGGYLAR